MTAARYAPPDADHETNLLEGIWLLDAKPVRAHACRMRMVCRHSSSSNFARAGGRALIFEPPDLFTAVADSRY